MTNSVATSQTYDVTSLPFQENPYPQYAAMRSISPVLPVTYPLLGSKVYFVTGYAEAMEILKDPTTFINDARHVPGADSMSNMIDKWYIPRLLRGFMTTMAFVDDPDHARLKQLVHTAFKASMISQMTASIEKWASRLLDGLVGKSTCDLVTDYALPLPINVICDMIGIEERDRVNFCRWMRSNLVVDLLPGGRLGMVKKFRHTQLLGSFIRNLVTERRTCPRNDLVTELVQAKADNGQMTEAELVSMIFLILFAGHETTVNLISSSVLALTQNPDQFDLLKASPDLMAGAIEEFLRYCSPTQHIAVRYTIRETTIGNTLIPKHSSIVVGIGAANHDERTFKSPEQLDITRNPKHLAFGYGAHFCVGAPLARIEGAIALNALISHFPNLSLAGKPDNLKWRGAPSLRGLINLPIHLT